MVAARLCWSASSARSMRGAALWIASIISVRAVPAGSRPVANQMATAPTVLRSVLRGSSRTVPERLRRSATAEPSGSAPEIILHPIEELRVEMIREEKPGCRATLGVEDQHAAFHALRPALLLVAGA